MSPATEVTLLHRVRGAGFRRRAALADANRTWSYGELERATRVICRLLEDADRPVGRPLSGERVAFLLPPGRQHVAVQQGIWLAGAIAVPLAVSHPPRELKRVLDDAAPRTVVADPSLEHAGALLKAAHRRGARAISLPPLADKIAAPGLEARSPGLPNHSDPALLIYTSGTTGHPKGVLSTHGNLAAQSRVLADAWGWSEQDRILHILPLHHIHGIVNALCCALWSGAACEFCEPDAARVWERLAKGDITLLMAVPTVYRRLVRAWEEAPAAVRRRWSRGGRRLRLAVSGSSALPVRTLKQWQEITGHTLLERYGMTEIGMALSNPLEGERRPGFVGQPLPEVEVRLVDHNGNPVAEGHAGQLAVRGPQVFREYWRRPAETAAAFRDGWFLTGDEACLERGYYKILGRTSTDILKTGGYKVSALEVEELYRTHPAVQDVAVVGVPDSSWGDRVCAAWVPAANREEGRESPVSPPARPTATQLRAWGKERLAPYKVPHEFEAVRRLPKNSMGKVKKAEVARLFASRPNVRSQPRTSR